MGVVEITKLTKFSNFIVIERELTKLFFINFIKKRLQYRCFPLNIAKNFRTFILKKHLQLAASIHLKKTPSKYVTAF